MAPALTSANRWLGVANQSNDVTPERGSNPSCSVNQLLVSVTTTRCATSPSVGVITRTRPLGGSKWVDRPRNCFGSRSASNAEISSPSSATSSTDGDTPRSAAVAPLQRRTLDIARALECKAPALSHRRRRLVAGTRGAVEHCGEVLEQLEPAIECAGGHQLESDVRVPVEDALLAGGAGDDREDDHAEPVHQPCPEQRPAQGEAAERVQGMRAISLHLPHRLDRVTVDESRIGPRQRWLQGR